MLRRDNNYMSTGQSMLVLLLIAFSSTQQDGFGEPNYEINELAAAIKTAAAAAGPLGNTDLFR